MGGSPSSGKIPKGVFQGASNAVVPSTILEKRLIRRRDCKNRIRKISSREREREGERKIERERERERERESVRVCCR